MKYLLTEGHASLHVGAYVHAHIHVPVFNIANVSKYIHHNYSYIIIYMHHNYGNHNVKYVN